MADEHRAQSNPPAGVQHSESEGGLYRDDGAGLASRRAALQRDYVRTIADMPLELVAAYGRRVARIWFGVVATAGGVAMFLAALVYSGLDFPLGSSREEAPTWILMATWVTAMFAYAMARKLAVRDVYAELARVVASSNDPHTDIARLRVYTPVKRTAYIIDRKERGSVAWPLAGLALIGPLSLHGLIAWLMDCSAAEFTDWIQVSALLVGHCHLFVAIFAVVFAGQVRSVSFGQPILRRTAWGHVFWVILLALVPAILPAVVVAATALVYIPLAYNWVARSVQRERTIILAAAGDVVNVRA